MQKYIEELKTLGSDRTKNTLINHGCDIECYGVKIGDMMKIIKRDKLQNNTELGIQLVESKIYDAMYMGFKMMDTKEVDKELLKKWATYTNASAITCSQIAMFVAENPEREELLKYFKNINDDKHQSIYYAALSGILMMEPEYKQDLIKQELLYIRDNILNLDLNETKKQMNGFISSVSIQCIELSALALEINNEIKDDLVVSFGNTKCNLLNVEKYYEGAKSRNMLAKKRKSCRC